MRKFALALAIPALLTPALAVADPAPESLPHIGTYAETYLRNPKVSGSLLVGLRWGGPEGNFDPANVRLRLPPVVQNTRACVDVVSKDGRYTAENLYAVAQGGQATLGVDTNYRTDLTAYSTADVGVIIRTGHSCDDEEGGFIPAVVVPLNSPAAPDTRRLVADVNSDPELVTALLVGPGGAELPAKTACVAAGSGVRIAYSTVCTIDPQAELPRSGIVLRLRTKERFKTIDNDFALLTP